MHNYQAKNKKTGVIEYSGLAESPTQFCEDMAHDMNILITEVVNDYLFAEAGMTAVPVPTVQ